MIALAAAPATDRGAHSPLASLEQLVLLAPAVAAMRERGFTDAELLDLVPGFALVQWLEGRKGPICWEDVRRRFGVSRASAYRALPRLRRLQRALDDELAARARAAGGLPG